MKVAEETVLGAAAEVLRAPCPDTKVAAAARAADLLAAGSPMGSLAATAPPARPARPDAPRLVPPSEVPRRRLGSKGGRAALLHAVAHIEFNAIDLAVDMALRFAAEIDRIGLNAGEFVADWISVGRDEARHFVMVNDRLGSLGCAYGKLPAHDGLWEAAERTSGSVLARLVVAPLILEARGLDVTPGMIERLHGAGDALSASALEVIYRDEIGHVACGKRWFYALCQKLDRRPVESFRELQAAYFSGRLKPPFNHQARAAAGLARGLYEPIANASDVMVDG